MLDILAQILRDRRLQPLFQPILDLDSGAIYGYEGLIRGPSDTIYHSPLALLRTAEQSGRRGEMEMLCVMTLLTEFARQGFAGNLFINLSPAILCEAEDRRAELMAMLEANRLAPERVIIELTEDGVPPDEQALLARLGEFKAEGLRIALDDLGEG